MEPFTRNGAVAGRRFSLLPARSYAFTSAVGQTITSISRSALPSSRIQACGIWAAQPSGKPLVLRCTARGSSSGLRIAVRMNSGSAGLLPAVWKSNTFSCAPLLPPEISPSCCEANTLRQVCRPTTGTQLQNVSTKLFCAMFGIVRTATGDVARRLVYAELRDGRLIGYSIKGGGVNLSVRACSTSMTPTIGVHDHRHLCHLRAWMKKAGDTVRPPRAVR